MATEDNGHGQEKHDGEDTASPSRNGKDSSEPQESNISEGRGNGGSQESGRGGDHEGRDAISEN